MTNLPQKFDKQEFISALDNAKNLISEAEKIGIELADDGYNNLNFVGCGAPYRVANLIKFWADLKIPQSKISNYLPAEFVDINPLSITEKSIILFGSYSGTTKETVDAAKFSGSKGSHRIGITRFDDSPLSQNVDMHLNFGDTRLGDYSRFIISSAFASAFLSRAAPEYWNFHESLINTLHHLPTILANIVEMNEEKILNVTREYLDIKQMFIVGHGPMYNIAYLLGFCSFVEMQKIHATPIIGAEFFHGPFELVDGSFPVIVLIGEDPTRQEGIRVKEFGEKYSSDFIIFDSQEYQFNTLPSNLRGYFAPIMLDAATRRFMDYFAVLRGHDKSGRRYMGEVEY